MSDLRIAVVEDEPIVAMDIIANLQNLGYKTLGPYERAEEIIKVVKAGLPDLIVLDWMLPGTSGIELCRQWRTNSKTANIPIIMLTARGEEAERVRGLVPGADDFMVKSFSMPELVARIEAILRRVNPTAIASTIKIGELELDKTTHRVKRSGFEVRLGPVEYRLLEDLMLSPGRVRSRQQLLDNVWGDDIYVDERTVDVHIGRLRKTLNRGQQQDPIRTVRGSGYAFDEKFSA